MSRDRERYMDSERDRLYGTLPKKNTSVHFVCVEMGTGDVKRIGLGIHMKRGLIDSWEIKT